MSYSNTPIDDDLQIKKGHSGAPDKSWYLISLDGQKGQTHDTLRACFNEVNFDPERPRQEFDDGHSGFSYYEKDSSAEIFAFPSEAQAIRNKGFAIKKT